MILDLVKWTVNTNHDVAKSHLELILLPPPLACWDCRCPLPGLALTLRYLMVLKLSFFSTKLNLVPWATSEQCRSLVKALTPADLPVNLPS